MLTLPGIASPRVTSFPVIAAAVCGIAAFNLCFHLHVDTIQQWDESLYATTAWEMLRSGDWIGTTFQGTLDYYNTKPPLNFWLIALSFKLFGVSLIALRLPSVVAAFATVALLVAWGRRHLGESTALFFGLVLGTMYPFFYVHAGRSANTDAINTCLVVVTVMILWGARARPWRLVWLGPVLAAVFLLRGLAVLLPAAIVAIDEVRTFGARRRGRWAPTAVAAAIFLVPVTAWMIARWHVDEWAFLSRVFLYDGFARSVVAIENHPGSVFYYLKILLRYAYDWPTGAMVAVALFPLSLDRVRTAFRSGRDAAGPGPLLLVWAMVAFLIPTAMQTKLPWYLHSFYPVFAIALGGLFAHSCRQATTAPGGWRSWRARTLVAVIVLAACVAQGRLIWYSYHHLDLSTSSQGLMIAERDALAGRAIYSNRFDRADLFVAHAMAGATHRLAVDVAEFMRDSRPGDFLLSAKPLHDPAIVLVWAGGGHYLYRRTE